jgi:hypothetical protein
MRQVVEPRMQTIGRLDTVLVSAPVLEMYGPSWKVRVTRPLTLQQLCHDLTRGHSTPVLLLLRIYCWPNNCIGRLAQICTVKLMLGGFKSAISPPQCCWVATCATFCKIDTGVVFPETLPI